jgi:hypothetical protein
MNVRYWHKADIWRCPLNGRYGVESGRLVLRLRIVEFDPSRTSANLSCCSSEGGLAPYQSVHLSRYDAAS